MPTIEQRTPTEEESMSVNLYTIERLCGAICGGLIGAAIVLLAFACASTILKAVGL